MRLRLLEQNAERLRQGPALPAADYGFRSAVHSGDEETIQSVLENHGERIGAAATALLDTDMAYRALTAPRPPRPSFPLWRRSPWVFGDCRGGVPYRWCPCWLMGWC